MGPTNIALVQLFRADQALREAQERLDAAAKNVRLQERKVADLSENLKQAQARLREQQAQGGQLDLDIKTRDAHIEKLRTQQQTAKNNKEYQTFLIEINTAKVDKNKVEDEAIRVMEAVEKTQAEVAGLTASVQAEKEKLATLRAQSDTTVTQLQAEVDALTPAREQAAAAVPPKAREAFQRLRDRFDEPMSALAKPDRRVEEYLCTECNMSLVADVYNKLHTRDDLVFCPSCRRILFIPEDLPPQAAINTLKAPVVRRSNKGEKGEKPEIERRAKGRWGELLAGAQGESVKAAVDADQSPVELQVMVNGELAGIYKGKTRDHLDRVIRFRMQEMGMNAEIQVLDGASQENAQQESIPQENAPQETAPQEAQSPSSST